MPYTSPFFSNTTGYTGEVSLFDDLVREQIKIYGIDILFMPRRQMNLDMLLHESSKNAFELAMPIPAYLKTFDGFDNGLEALTKFGVRNADEITLQISRSEFTTHYAPFIKSYYNAIAGRPGISELPSLEGETAHRPKEGDLIYFPFDDSIFEIKYVQFDVPFFQLGTNYVFELQCEKFEYSGATFDTGYDKVDDTTEEIDYYRLEFHLVDGGEETFLFNERVKIYNLSYLDPTVLDGGASKLMGLLQTLETGTADIYYSDQIINCGDSVDWTEIDMSRPFSLYKDAGYTHKVEVVDATVQYWNKEEQILTVSDLSDLDPTQDNDQATTLEDNRNLTINKFDQVVIIGTISNAKWYSFKAETADKAFDDEKIIQEEFDEIKIVDDPRDINPFGFY